MKATWGKFKISRISRHLIFVIVLVSLAIMLISTAVQTFRDYHDGIDTIEHNIEMIRKSDIDLLTKNVWNLDQQTIKLQLEGLLKLQDVEQVEISQDGQILWSSGKKVSRISRKQEFPLVYEINGKKMSVGTFSMIVSISNVYNRLIRNALTILISNTLIVFLISAAILIVFQYLVTRHLVSIANYVQNIVIGHETGELKLGRKGDPTNQSDELDWVVQAINLMQNNLKSAFVKLVESENRFRALVETSNDIIWSIDRENRLTYVSPAVFDLLGYKPSDAIGKSLLQTVKNESNREYHGELLNVFELKKAFTGLISENLHKNGDLIVFDTNGVPITNADNEIIGMQGISRDITERRQNEAELDNYRKHLEEKVRQRTLDLEATNKELEAFAYSVSHDLRSPLRSLDGFSQVLLEDYENVIDETGQDYLKRIRAASQRMGILIDDILKLSKLTRSEMTFMTVEVSRLVSKILEEQISMEPDRKTEFRIQPDLNVSGDANLLKVALENLIGNAWKFSSKKAVTVIEFGLDNSESSDKQTFFLKDYGAGFDSSYSDKLFGAFQRLHAVTEFPGTGIGLAIVQRIIHRHGGQIWAESEIDKGSTFYFSI